MKSFLKGIFYGLSLVVVHKICILLFWDFSRSPMLLCSGILFFITSAAFLTSDDMRDLLLCGFTGLFSMFFGEILSFSLNLPSPSWYFEVYIAGFFATMASLVYSIYLTLKKRKFFTFANKEVISMEISKDLKIKLIIYTVVSAITFSYLVLPESSGIGVSVFVILQAVMLYFIVPYRKRLFLLLPVFVLSLNSFLSASSIWDIPNTIICFSLTACMFFKFDFKNDSLIHFKDMSLRIVSPLHFFKVPFRWLSETGSEKSALIKKIIIALIITIPSTIILVCVLSSADMVFSMKADSFLTKLFEAINFTTLFKIFLGIIAGLYLFGVQYAPYAESYIHNGKALKRKGDLVIINIVLCGILLVYTLFVIVQFRYLFSGSALPEGLTYTEYARKGFFELLSLTGVNIAIILTVTKLIKLSFGKWKNFSQMLCTYLCAVTVVLLISSFYRMYLYTADDGLTRLRFFVMGFLIFELIGLIITFIYIVKPSFNITLIYTIIALCYYMLLNTIHYDRIIAKNQIDMYLEGKRNDLSYIFTLSPDALPAMEYLIKNTDDDVILNDYWVFVMDNIKNDIPERWQRYNLSEKKLQKSYAKLSRE